MQHTNKLILESSPYLLQHAHNPVNWYPWSEEAFAKAKSEDKLVLVSIGYSSCHWCHVMEHESFEDEKVAKVMNDFFVCIKVDREERPDIDQIYMDAVQLMSGQGGWPLNCFTLPDGKPVYGGTYFNKEQWLNILLNLHALYKDEKEKVISYGEKLTHGIRSGELINGRQEKIFSQEELAGAVKKISDNFDSIEGGPNRAPKFPMPCLYNFLLNYGHFKSDKKITDHVKLTLDKMAMGGIYDQIGGGFSRYSVDMVWKVPHFEKMLYDNAQLVSLYSNAYKKFRSDLYKEAVYQTFDFLQRELSNGEGGYFCALDADSEGEEGKYYVWTKDEFKQIAGEDFEWASSYYNLNYNGAWEDDNYILLRRESDEEFAKAKGWSREGLRDRVNALNKKLLFHREKRVRPGLDDKTLTSWNGMMIKGFTDAYKSFGDEKFRDAALACAHFIMGKQLKGDGGLFHNYKNGKSTVEGFLEDYAFTIDAFQSLYEITGDEKWVERSEKLISYCREHFFDAESGLFFFTHKSASDLIARKTELYDNVIPSSNSVMSMVLGFQGKISGDTEFLQLAEQMKKNISEFCVEHLSSFSNWADVISTGSEQNFEVAVCGEKAEEFTKQIQSQFLPGVIFAYSVAESKIPLLTERLKTGKTMIYICKNNSCNLPVESVEEALKQLQ